MSKSSILLFSTVKKERKKERKGHEWRTRKNEIMSKGMATVTGDTFKIQIFFKRKRRKEMGNSTGITHRI